MAYYPIAVDLTDKQVLVVGGGTVARRKIETLLDFGARVTVISPEVIPEIRDLAESGRIELLLRGYKTGDLYGMFMVIAATDDRAVNELVSEDAGDANIPVNVVDVPELCSFIVQSVVRRGDITISVGSGGKSPALSKHIRKIIEGTIGPEYGDLAAILAEVREIAKERIPKQETRERIFKEIIASDILEQIRKGHNEQARKQVMEILNGMDEGKTNP